MASVQPYKTGFTWVKSLSAPTLGTPPIVEKVVVSNNTLNLFTGDLLIAVVDGTVYPATVGSSATFVCAGASNYRQSDGLLRKGSFLPAGTTYTGTVSRSNPLASRVLCIPVQDQIFAATVPTAAATTTAATALIGNCIDIAIGVGSTVSGQSAHTVYDPTSDGTNGWKTSPTTATMRLVEIPQFGIGGSANDVTAANWTGWFMVNEIVVAI